MRHVLRPLKDDRPDDGLIVRILWNRRYLIGFCVMAMGLLALVHLRYAERLYTSTALLKYEPGGREIVDFGGERSTILYQRDEIKTAVELIESPRMALAVLDALGVEEPEEASAPASPLSRALATVRSGVGALRDLVLPPPALDPSDAEARERQDRAGALLEKVTVAQRSETKLIEINVHHPDKVTAQRIADEFCHQFIQSINEENRQRFSYAREYLAAQLEGTHARLEEAEKALFDFSGQSDIRVMSESREISLKAIGRLSERIEEQRALVARLEAEKKALEDGGDPLLLFDEREAYRSLLDRKSELLVQRAQQQAENRPEFLELSRLNQAIAGIDEQMQEVVAGFRDSKARELDIARALLANLQEQLGEQRKKVNTLEEQMIEFRVLDREVAATRQILETLLDQYKRLEVADDAKPSNVLISQPATYPTAPTSPRPMRTLLLFGFAGLVLGGALSVALYAMDRTVKSAAQVEGALGLPTLGAIPRLRGARRGSLLGGRAGRIPCLAPSGDGMENEAVRYVRTSVQYSAAHKAPQVLLVTSCVPQEGKSTVSANLAGSFAERGQRVLLIDADLKRPSLHTAFDMSRMPGLSDVLTGQAELSLALRDSGRQGLDFLPAGTPSPSPTALLESETMAELVERLRGDYGTIVIDSAPTHGMSDALLLARNADGVVLVVKHATTRIDHLGRAAEKLRSVGAAVLGVVYNDMRASGSEMEAYGTGSAGYYSSVSGSRASHESLSLVKEQTPS